MHLSFKPVRNFLRQQSFRMAMLLAVAAITCVGWCWMALENKTIWMGAISPSGRQFITYTYDEIARSGWKVATHIRDVETGKVLHDLSRFHFSWSKSIAWADETTLVATVMVPSGASQSGDQLTSMVTIRLDDDLTVLDQKPFGNQRPSSLRVTSDGEIAFAVVENENTIQPRYLEIRKTPFVDGAADNATRLLSRLEFGTDEQAFCSRATHTQQDVLVVDICPVWGATKGDFVITDGVTQTTIFFDLKAGEVLHEVRGGYEAIGQPPSNEFLAKETTTGIDVYRVENVSEAVAKFAPKNGGTLNVLAFGERWQVIREEGPSSITFQVIDRQRNTIREFRFTDRRAYVFLSGTNLFAMSEGKLERINLEQSDHRRLLVNVRPFVRVFAATSMVGVPLFVLCVLVGLVRAASWETFFDVAFACTLAASSFAVWGQADFTRGYEVFFLSMAVAFLGTAFAVLLVWVSTSKAIFGLGIPLITIALAAATVLCKIAWPDSGGAEIALVGFSWLILFQSIGHVLFRQFVGRIVTGEIDDRAQAQFSLRQAGVFTAAVAVLLACVRWVSLGDAPSSSVIVWVVLFTGAYSVSVLLAQWCALRNTNRLVSFMLCLLGTVATLGCFHLISRSTRLHPNFGGTFALQIYAQPVIAALVVWTTWQIARRAGYRLHRVW